MAHSFSWRSPTSNQLLEVAGQTIVPESKVERRGRGGSASPKLLAVDDDPLVLRTLQRMLKATRPTWAITGAPDAPTALRLLGSEHFDVLLTDLDMPGMRGEELLETALGIDPALTCVVHSGQIEVLKPALRSKLSGVLGKPATMSELSEALDNSVAASRRGRLKAMPLV